MKDYSVVEILDVLEKSPRAKACFTDEVKEKALNNPCLKEYFRTLEEEGEKLRGEALTVLPFSAFRRFETPGDGNRSEFEFGKNGYFPRRKRLLTFALLAWLYGRREDICALEDVIWAIADEYTWALPAHLQKKGLSVLQSDGYMVDLFAAETAHALAETLALLGDKLHPIIVARVKSLVKERIFDRLGESFHWKRGNNNWAAVCSGAIGMAAIYQVEDNRRLAEIIEMVLSCMKNYLSGFSDDGACLEGLGYWSYGFGYFSAFAEMLLRLTDGEINLFNDSKVRSVAMFYRKCFFKGGRIVSFSDAPVNVYFSLGTMNLFNKLYSESTIPSLKYMRLRYSKTGCFRFAFGVRQIAWAADAVENNIAECYGTHVFPDAQWYIASSNDGNVGIAAKAGHNGEPHNHNDVGVFQIFKNGETIIADIGGGEYNQSYFSPERYEKIFCCSSRGHGVPIVNGKYQSAGTKFAARNVVITKDGLTADIAGAYNAPELNQLTRQIRFDRQNNAVFLKDYCCFNEPSAFIDRLLTPHKPLVKRDHVVINAGKESMSVFFDASVVKVEISREEDKNHQGENRLTYIIDFVSRKPALEHLVLLSIRDNLSCRRKLGRILSFKRNKS